MPALSSQIVGERPGGHVAGMQRRRLLLAIGELLGGGGIEGASVGRICKRAGVSRRTFYELFEDREACLLAAFDDAIERIAKRVAPVYASAGRWNEKLRAALAVTLDLLEAQPDVARMCVVETLRAGPAVLARRRQVVETLTEIVEQGRTEPRTGAQAPPLTAQGVVGGALSVIHGRLLLATRAEPVEPGLVELTGPLMAMIVHPYLGAAAARRDLELPVPNTSAARPRVGADPFKGLPIRFTYRTARVLATIASEPGASNRHLASSSGIADDGQMSRLLRRLEQYGLVENRTLGPGRGEANAWRLTVRGEAIQTVIDARPVT